MKGGISRSGPGKRSLDRRALPWDLKGVRRVIAAGLLVCFGIILPVAAVPTRVCLLERKLMVSSPGEAEKCCSECQRDSEDPEPCCHDLDGLPDSQAPHPGFELPALPVVDLPSLMTPLPISRVSDLKPDAHEAPIRGPTSPAGWRAVLAVWRL